MIKKTGFQIHKSGFPKKSLPIHNTVNTELFLFSQNSRGKLCFSLYLVERVDETKCSKNLLFDHFKFFEIRSSEKSAMGRLENMAVLFYTILFVVGVQYLTSIYRVHSEIPRAHPTGNSQIDENATETKVEVQKVLKKENCKKMPPNLSKRLVSGFMC